LTSVLLIKTTCFIKQLFSINYRTGGEFSSEYSGPRDADGIVKYMRSQVGPASRLYDTKAKLEEALNKAKEAIVLGIFEKDDKSPLQTKFLKAADKLRESVNFGHVFTETVADVYDLKLFTDLKEKTTPVVVLIRPNDMRNKFEPNYVVYSSGDVDAFVKENFHGIVGLRTQSNVADFKVGIVDMI
jgi:protein disulfide isomerase family A protein 3